MKTQVTKQFRAEIAHRLPDHPGACKFLHGHSYLFEVTAVNDLDELNELGMVVDFKDLKAAVEKAIGEWDHATVLSEDDVLAETLRHCMQVKLVTLPFIPTAENMAKFIAEETNIWLPTNVSVVAVRVWETATSYADWRACSC